MSLQACAAMVERGDPDRFAATMAAPPPARELLWPLYALNLEVARAPWASSEPMIAEMRLQWWRDAVEETGAGRPARAHEVMRPLADVIAARHLPLAVIDRMIEARRWEIARAPFADLAALEAHIDATSGNLMWLAAWVLGAERQAEPVVRDFAFGVGLAAWLRAVPDLEARGAVPLPDGRPTAIAGLATAGLARIRAARHQRGRIAPAVRPALLVGWQAATLLRRAEADPGRVAQGTLGQSEFARRGSLLWKSATGGW